VSAITVTRISVGVTPISVACAGSAAQAAAMSSAVGASETSDPLASGALEAGRLVVAPALESGPALVGAGAVVAPVVGAGAAEVAVVADVVAVPLSSDRPQAATSATRTPTATTPRIR
jgi:hypothetical protein